ncbi:hypothetical protein HK413_05760 [Mucilaginibacter sp. S1162]|uniref:Uncharacterized protein n=1 Tax=Mucilaginibacter humi TaxID=2732510 RepID=A0ABX1W596_9SPHI|nr:hypothetical protein [Mucilaginibacter humi]NNU33766.1 hypothetical protein [Mucilaginibacter humi]
MIRNLQVQTEVLNQQLNVIEQFNEFKNQKMKAKIYSIALVAVMSLGPLTLLLHKKHLRHL